MALGHEKYVALTTHRKDGTTSTVPVWIADLPDGKLGFTTGSSSYKVKRIRNDGRVTLQPSDSRGNPRAGTEPASATVVVVDGAEFEPVQAAVKGKYGLQFHLMGVFGKVRALMGKGESGDCAVVMTLDE